MCENFKLGACKNSNCNYAHDAKELRYTDNLYKTSMCIQFMKGNCRNGDFCRYAHSQKEKRNLESTEEEKSSGNNERRVKKLKSGYFKEDIAAKQNSIRKDNDNIDNEITVKNLRKVVHSSDYENEVDDDSVSQFSSFSNRRYNYLNPFFIFAPNAAPSFCPIKINQTVPLLNFLSINKTDNNVSGNSVNANHGQFGIEFDQNTNINRIRNSERVKSFVRDNSRETEKRKILL